MFDVVTFHVEASRGNTGHPEGRDSSNWLVALVSRQAGTEEAEKDEWTCPRA